MAESQKTVESNNIPAEAEANDKSEQQVKQLKKKTQRRKKMKKPTERQFDWPKKNYFEVSCFEGGESGTNKMVHDCFEIIIQNFFCGCF